LSKLSKPFCVFFFCFNFVFVHLDAGTGAWESALTNTLSPGDKILTFRLGQFSLLWVDQMQRLNFDVDVVDVEWGYGIDLGVLRQKLQADIRHEIKAICAVHNETATGVTNDLKGIRTILGMLCFSRTLVVSSSVIL
jgi:alanine-glyoxylate transaminase/serine-glyoxylate transaminase/serine-pyruvate transaminase